jgi:serine/threonine protein kinase
VQGETLRALIAGRRVELKRLLDYLAQAADALAAAHAAGIVHRDLKPDNIMVADGGYAKVLDFGLAKLRAEAPLMSAAADEPTVTRVATGERLAPATAPGLVMGTVGYMSPEQAQGLPVDARSDIFSFGCIIYEAATGARPFSGASAIDTLHQIIHGQPTPIAQLAPSCPLELQRIVRKCLAKSPDERYQSMKDVALDLRDLRREIDSGSTPSVTLRPPQRSVRPGLAWLAGGAVLLAVIAALWWFGGRAGTGDPIVQAPL